MFLDVSSAFAQGASLFWHSSGLAEAHVLSNMMMCLAGRSEHDAQLSIGEVGNIALVEEHSNKTQAQAHGFA